MTALTGLVITSKADLLRINNNNAGTGVSGSLVTIYDGAGNATGYKISSTGGQIGNIQFSANTITTSSGAIAVTPAVTFNGAVTFASTVAGITLPNPVTIGSYTATLGGNLVTGGTFTTAGNFTTSGSTYNLTCTLTGNTSVTFPTSGTLCTTVGSSSIVTVGTIVTGTWNATALTVPYGGTGLTSATAYAVLLGGTTSTGAFQSVASVGTAAQVLTSNGAGTKPTFQDLPTSGNCILIQSQAASSSASLTFSTGITTAYKAFKIYLTNVAPASDGVVLRFRVGTSGGINAGSEYTYGQSFTSTAGANTGGGGSGASNVPLTGSGGCGNSTSEFVNGEITVANVGAVTCIQSNTTYRDTTGAFFRASIGGECSVNSIDRFQVVFASGNIASGTVSVYGLT